MSDTTSSTTTSDQSILQRQARMHIDMLTAQRTIIRILIQSPKHTDTCTYYLYKHTTPIQTEWLPVQHTLTHGITLPAQHTITHGMPPSACTTHTYTRYDSPHNTTLHTVWLPAQNTHTHAMPPSAYQIHHPTHYYSLHNTQQHPASRYPHKLTTTNIHTPTCNHQPPTLLSNI